jgi:ribosome maturation factor RimP
LFTETGDEAVARKIHPVVQEIEGQLRQVVEGLGYELVLVKYGGPRRRPILTVFIDKEGGVGIEDCGRVSQRLSVLLDVLDPIPSSYELVVSSPGLERPLVREEDYVRFSGRRAAVTRARPGARREVIVGTLRGLDKGFVLVEHGGEVEAVAMDEIEDAHIVYEWET